MLHIKVKGNEAYNNMLANVLPLHTPVTPGVGSKGQFFVFSESNHVACKIKGNEAETTLQTYILPFCTPTTPDGIKTIFFWRIMLHIKLKGKKCRTLCKADFMHTLTFGLGKKVRHWNCADKYTERNF